MASSLFKPTSDQLRTIVLDYLCHSCYTATAKAFIKDSTVRHVDADGDEIIRGTTAAHPANTEMEAFEVQLKQVELRKEIRTEIMCGRVESAITLLNRHFPFVLSTAAEPPSRPSGSTSTNNFEYISETSTEPEHLQLNLRILAFSESCRTMPLNYPPVQSADDAMDEDVTMHSNSDEEDDDDDDEDEEDEERRDQQLHLLTRAQKLYAFTNTLTDPQDRATYLKELENVAGLLAYKVPEESPMAKYLTLERREAVADQINRAILKRTGKPLISSLELSARYTTLLWYYAHQLGVKKRGNAVVPPSSKQDVPEGDKDVVPQFDLHHFMETKSSGQKA